MAYARNAELEAHLVAHPDDEAAIAVYADWLIERGEPWGEVIALGATDPARVDELLRDHDDFKVGLDDRTQFAWQRGFVHAASIRGPRELLRGFLERVFDLPMTILLSQLAVGGPLDDAAVAVLSRRAPRSLRAFRGLLLPAIAQLSHPGLVHLRLGATPRHAYVVGWHPPEPAEYGALFAARGLPAVRDLQIFDGQLSVAFVDALLESPLVGQLERLALVDCLTADAVERVIEHRHELAHLAAVAFASDPIEEDTPEAIVHAFGAQHRAFDTAYWRAPFADIP
ncbi:MAG TPA: TIGR02996 domain-containing protein [Kofleriaceae bacterium]|nr:TIGR02996 domain-containing protein [Kofleriaceae bacterium]